MNKNQIKVVILALCLLPGCYVRGSRPPQYGSRGGYYAPAATPPARREVRRDDDRRDDGRGRDRGEHRDRD
jgi:hypothetical protein